ncbi:MAG TPA: hypothetical protein VN606_09100 [Thermoleophilaceae bacterium]|jgi:hypothetical protein|nr:hypothetical protein [Thermoleophilaceae bacterium]
MSPLLALLAAIAFVVPATAAARKNAWQLSAPVGHVRVHAANSSPPACSAGAGAVLLKRDYTETWPRPKLSACQDQVRLLPGAVGLPPGEPGKYFAA